MAPVMLMLKEPSAPLTVEATSACEVRSRSTTVALASGEVELSELYLVMMPLTVVTTGESVRATPVTSAATLTEVLAEVYPASDAVAVYSPSGTSAKAKAPLASVVAL